jgi:hypothetical protein
MLIVCWSAKGGSGTTVAAASMALMLARRESAGALIADLAGDVPAVLGMSEEDSPGIREGYEQAPRGRLGPRATGTHSGSPTRPPAPGPRTPTSRARQRAGSGSRTGRA